GRECGSGVERAGGRERVSRSHVQPEPKRLTPASLTCVLRSSSEPNVESIAAARSPLGEPPPLGLIVSQNSEWFAWPPPLLRTAVRLSSGTWSRFEISASID